MVLYGEERNRNPSLLTFVALFQTALLKICPLYVA